MASDHPPKQLPTGSVWLAHWLLFAAACNVAGWALSAIDQLNPLGLFIAVPLSWMLMARLARVGLPKVPCSHALRRWKKRYSRPLPAAFALFALLSLIGGIIYPPNNFDALIYRIPRVAHWLMEEGWEWIPTVKNNLNTRSAGFEWWTAPMLALLRTDRLVFLVNLVSFLFLPGLFFHLFRSMGVPGRAARAWMWLMPTGYCFLFQASSVSNDMLAALFAMAAFDFGFRWKKGGGYPCFALALLGCAMMTAIKPTTLPLLLPFAVLFFGMWKPAFGKPLTSAALAILFALSSFLPTAVINVRQCGDWTGAAAEDAKLGSVEPVIGIVTNTINTATQNLFPPVFPLAGVWNRTIVEVLPASFFEASHRSFEAGGANLAAVDFQGEESAGIGTGLTVLLIVSVLLGFREGRSSSLAKVYDSYGKMARWVVAMAFLLALVVYFSRAGMSTVARHIAPFYPFFFALCLSGRGQGKVVSSRIWRCTAALAILMALGMTVIIPSRPLWPARTVLANVDARSPKILQRAKLGYEVYAGRADGLGPVRDALPADASVVGYLSYSASPELPLWKPYMERSLRHLLPKEDLFTLRAAKVPYLVLNTDRFETYRGISPDDWVRKGGGIVRSRVTLRLLARHEPSEWWVIEIPPAIPTISEHSEP